MKKLIEKYKKLYKNSSIFRIFLLLLIGALIIFEGRNIYIDYYNFQQLEKAKQVVENFEKSGKKLALPVRTLDDFNYGKGTNFSVGMGADIEPLDKRYCYYVYYDRDTTGSGYIFEFGFKLNSLLYKLKYLSFNYAYPKQIEKEEPSEACKEELKLPYLGLTGMPACAGLNASYYRYLKQISNPCER